MGTPWYRRLFSIERGADLTAVRTRADQGDADAQFTLGLSFSFGSGNARNDAEAAGWFRRAADQGHALAQFNLAVMYANGQGVTFDEAEAARWYRRAADHGDAGGQFQTGVRCHRRSFEASKPDASESGIEAYKWFNLASAQGYKDSKDYLDRVNLRLTREEIDEGQRRAADFRPS